MDAVVEEVAVAPIQVVAVADVVAGAEVAVVADKSK